MKAFLLAAGLGTRLRPVTETTPKCLVPVRGKPLLAHWLELLFESGGIESALINTHYLAEMVERFASDTPYKEQVHLVHEARLLGTAGSLLKNRTFFGESPVMLIHADNYSIFDVNDFIRAHRTRPDGCEITMMTFATDVPESCGIVELDSKNRVEAFHEKVDKPPGNLANGAVYIVEPTVFSFLEGLGKSDIDFSTEVLPEYTGRIYTFHNQTYHRDIGTPESLEKAQELK